MSELVNSGGENGTRNSKKVERHIAHIMQLYDDSHRDRQLSPVADDHGNGKNGNILDDAGNQGGQWYNKLPSPIVVVASGAAGPAMPVGWWCPRAALTPGTAKGKTYTAANGPPIKNNGEQIASMMTRTPLGPSPPRALPLTS